MAFKMTGPSLYDSPLTKKTPGGAKLIKTGKKKKDNTVYNAIEAAKEAARDDKAKQSNSNTTTTTTTRTKVVKPPHERVHYTNIPGFN
tara:strand:+ start:193 stop:456 length:264 start_codon:yes stop_codon:yes gene_type:complete